MSDINSVVLVGRLVRDPEVRTTPRGVSVGNFTLAVNRRFKVNGEAQEETAFVPCAVFNLPAQWLGEHKKGEKVAVSGRLPPYHCP